MIVYIRTKLLFIVIMSFVVFISFCHYTLRLSLSLLRATKSFVNCRILCVTLPVCLSLCLDLFHWLCLFASLPMYTSVSVSTLFGSISLWTSVSVFLSVYVCVSVPPLSTAHQRAGVVTCSRCLHFHRTCYYI